jgi:hypothetical protein
MAMRETVGSLRAYFILVGVLGAGLRILSLTDDSNGIMVKVAAGIDIALGLAFLACGVFLTRLLRDSPGLIKGVLYVSAAVQVVSAAIVFAVIRLPLALILPTITLLIIWYLLANVNRLSRIEKSSKAAG